MLQQFFRSVTSRTLLLLAFLSIFSSFGSFKGGDVIEIYLNEKKVLQQFVSMDPTAVKTFSLDKSYAKDKLRVSYSHCGQVGKARTLTTTNESKKLLKTWSFANNSKDKLMTCDAADVLALVKDNGQAKLNLVYTSEEIPGGKLLAVMLVNKMNTEIGKAK